MLPAAVSATHVPRRGILSRYRLRSPHCTPTALWRSQFTETGSQTLEASP
jgi:hypothetical protein